MLSGMSLVNYYRPLRCRGREIAVGAGCDWYRFSIYGR